VTPVLQAVLFLTIVVGLWSALHLYLWRRVVTPLELSPRGLRVARAVVAVGAALVPLVFVGNRWVGLALWAQPVLWLGYLYAGLVGIALPLLWMRDLALLAARPLGLDLERRKVLLRVTNTAVGGVSAALGGYGVWAARHGPEIVEVTVPVPNLPEAFEGYRIAQITDVHVGLTITGPFIEPIVAAVNGLKPDLIAVTGDLIDGSVELLRAHVAPLASLKAPDGVYFVTGNHEYFYDALAWCDEAERLGMTVLNEAHRVVTRGEARLLVAGVTDPTGKRYLPEHSSSVSEAVKGAPPCEVKLLLAHQPKNVLDAAKKGFHLQLSGHTHGGQFFPYTVFIDLVWKWGPGLHLVDNTRLYVSRGTCYWGPPMRSGDGSPSEITLLKLTRAQGAA
jgi:uncharacterized protein